MSKNKGNFIELLEIFADDSMKIRLQSSYGHYISPEYQNDLIHILGCHTRINILIKLSSFCLYSILVDETKDSSKKEQLNFVIQFVDNNFNIFEKILGCSHMKKSDATTLAQEIVKFIQDNNLDINK